MSVIKNVEKSDLKFLYDHSAMTWEGLIKEDFEKALEVCGGEDAIGYYMTGAQMNSYYHLTGKNAYPKDLNIFSVYPFKGLAIQYGARWFDDIIDNNRRRQ